MAEGGGAPPAEAVRRGVSKSLFAAVVIVVAIIAFAGGIGFGSVFLKAGPAPPKTTLVVGTNVPFPPFEDFNTSTGEFVGFDMDIIALFAKELDRTLVVRQYSNFNTLLADVGVGNVDMAASAITIKADRNKSMTFSDSYYNANQGVLVQSSSQLSCPGSICGVNELKTLIVGVQLGTTSQIWANQYLKPNMTNPDNLKVFERVDTEIAALKQGALDAVILDLDPANSFAAAPGSGLKVAGSIITNEQYGFAVPLGDPDKILPAINRVLSRIRTDGTYNTLIAKWFG